MRYHLMLFIHKWHRILLRKAKCCYSCFPNYCTNKHDEGLKHLSYEERQREMEEFSTVKGRLKRDLISLYKHLKGGWNEENGASLFSVVTQQETIGSNSNTGRSLWVSGNTLLCGWWSMETGFPENLWSLAPWRSSKAN